MRDTRGSGEQGDHARAWHGAAEARRRVVLADVGAAVGRRVEGLRRLQQVERHRRDRRGTWTMMRRFPTGAGVYNLAASHDGKLLVGTNKRGQSVSVVDLASGKEIALLPTKRKVASGVVISPDDRYAFVTVEGIGSRAGNRRRDRSACAANGRDRRRRAAGGRHRLLEDGAGRRRTDRAASARSRHID